MARQDLFVGRADATDRLLAVLRGEHAADGAVTVCSIEGPGGIGKTALLQHALARVDLDALKYLRLRADGRAGVENADVFTLAARIVDGAESLPTSKRPAGHFFPTTRRVLGLVSEVQKECVAEFSRIVPDDEGSRGHFAAVLAAALALGDAINVALPRTRQWLDCGEPSRRKIEEAVLKAHSLKPTLRRLGGILPDFWGVEERNAVKTNALKALADALLADLSAVLSGYRSQDRFKPMLPKQDGIDRLLLVIDDYEALADPLGGFVVRYLIPALGAARFRSVVLVLGRDQLQNTDPGWDQHHARALVSSLALQPLPRAEMDQLAEGFGVTERAEKDRIWNDTLGYVKVHTPDKRDGAVLPAKRASTACTIQASTFRFCLRHVSTTVSSRSTNRLPSADCVPNDNFRQITA